MTEGKNVREIFRKFLSKLFGLQTSEKLHNVISLIAQFFYFSISFRFVIRTSVVTRRIKRWNLSGIHVVVGKRVPWSPKLNYGLPLSSGYISTNIGLTLTSHTPTLIRNNVQGHKEINKFVRTFFLFVNYHKKKYSIKTNL